MKLITTTKKTLTDTTTETMAVLVDSSLAGVRFDEVILRLSDMERLTHLDPVELHRWAQNLYVRFKPLKPE